MADLLVIHSGANSFRMPLMSQRFTCGSNPLDDFCFMENPEGLRFSLEQQGNGGYQLVDRAVGAVVNGQRVQTRILEHLDQIGAGPYVLRYLFPREEAHTHRMSGRAPLEGARVFLEATDGTRYRVTERGLTLGTADTCDVVLKDPTVSRHHVTLHQKNGTTQVKDLKSTNGTVVNGVPVSESEAPPGCTLELGAVRFRVVNLGQRRADDPPNATEVCGQVFAHASMHAMFDFIRKCAASPVPVLILGESGSGKEGVARALHEYGPHKSAPFVPFNAASFTTQMAESELFGHERGAFTGALTAHAGLFEQAGKGTLFLDEVGELPLDIQAKLLRVLEQREVRRVGGSGTRPVECRVVCATHRDLEEEVREKRFRLDLFHRLAGATVRVPPLRDRASDIPLLARHLLDSSQQQEVTWTPAAMERLMAHPWPGNVRELRNVLFTAALMAGGRPFDVHDLDLKAIGLEHRVAMDRIYAPGRTLKMIETAAMEQAVEVHGSKVAAAQALGVTPNTVRAVLNRKGDKG